MGETDLRPPYSVCRPRASRPDRPDVCTRAATNGSAAAVTHIRVRKGQVAVKGEKKEHVVKREPGSPTPPPGGHGGRGGIERGEEGRRSRGKNE